MMLRISKICDQAGDRPSGYLEDVLSSGTVDGDFLEISAEAHATLRTKYRPSVLSVPLVPSHSGLTISTASDHEKQGHVSGCCDSALNPPQSAAFPLPPAPPSPASVALNH